MCDRSRNHSRKQQTEPQILALIGLLFVGNVVFHLESLRPGGSNAYGMRIGIGTAVLLITVMGGRIIPSFTRNWLAHRPPGSMPTAFNRFDMIAIVSGAAAIALWVVAPSHYATAILALVAAVLSLCTKRTTGRRLCWPT